MGQGDVLEILQDNMDKWFTSREVCEKSDSSVSSVVLALKKLREQGFVERRRNPDDRYGFQHRLKS